MKKLYFILLFLAVVFSTRAQVNYHFPHNNAVWGQFDGGFGITTGYMYGGTNFQTAAGDTLLSGNSYIKIYQSDSMGNTLQNLIALVREDSMGKVYYRINKQDELLYNFNVNVGDTIIAFDPKWMGGNVVSIVNGVGSYSDFGEQRKTIILDRVDPNNNPIIWIEGIGSNGGLLEPYGVGDVADIYAWLTCFTQNDTLKYIDPQYSRCNLSFTQLGIDGSRTFPQSIISPNPSTGIFNFSPLQDDAVIIHNCMGELIFRGQTKGYIDLRQQPDGIYFLSLLNQNGIIINRQKLVKLAE